ncbi:MAG: T9SS C-terminal target domain-containing protein [Ignavibacteriales bacterium]|nr:MAG: T9SS C-terminal target domain-containing protein [Ignavibacteriales bacterium]
MKQLITLSLLLFSVGLFGQTTIDFETYGQDWHWTVFANGPSQDSTDYAVVTNPSATGINTSSGVGKYIVRSDGDPWSGFFTDDIVDFKLTADNSMPTVMVYKDVISNFNLKLEFTEGGNHDVNVPNTVVNQWEKLTFDYSADIGKTVYRLTLIPDFPSTRTGGSTNYFDNIEFIHNNVPVELTSFTAKVAPGVVKLEWKTATEVNNRGFEVERSVDKVLFSTITFVDGKGTTTSANSYAYQDKNIAEGKTYYYRLKQIDYDGTYEYSDVIEAKNNVPEVFSLKQNYPNPFNPSTSIKFGLPVDSRVTLQVYNMIGQVVATLADGNYSAGTHNVNFDASGLTSGMYIYNIKTLGIDGKTMNATRKMLMMK